MIKFQHCLKTDFGDDCLVVYQRKEGIDTVIRTIPENYNREISLLRFDIPSYMVGIWKKKKPNNDAPFGLYPHGVETIKIKPKDECIYPWHYTSRTESEQDCIIQAVKSTIGVVLTIENAHRVTRIMNSNYPYSQIITYDGQELGTIIYVPLSGGVFYHKFIPTKKIKQ